MARFPKPIDPEGAAIAAWAVLTTLLDEIVSDGLLSTDQIRAVFQRADSGVAIMPDNEATIAASQLIAELFTRFPDQ
jgi:hypothetical protein